MVNNVVEHCSSRVHTDAALIFSWTPGSTSEYVHVAMDLLSGFRVLCTIVGSVPVDPQSITRRPY